MSAMLDKPGGIPEATSFAKIQQESMVKNAQKLPLLSFLTYTPVPNVLGGMSTQARRSFFDSLTSMNMLQRQQMNQLAQYVVPNRSLHLSDRLQLEEQRHHEQKQKEDMLSSLLERAAKAKEGYKEGVVLSSLGPNSSQVLASQEQLCLVLDEYARGDETRVRAAVSELEARLAAKSYKADDLMATLLIVIEDQVWEGKKMRILPQKPSPTQAKIIRAVPARLKVKIKASSEVRLASVREMLRYYFLKYPKDYALALCIALGIPKGKEGDIAFLQEQLASELARVGCFAFAQKMLLAVKRLNGMDTKKCLLKLGFAYDTRAKKTIIGKRTCGAPVEAVGIIDLLLKGAKKIGA